MSTCSKYLAMVAGMTRESGERMDANETAVLARQLEHIEREVTRQRYPDLKALNFVPAIGGIDPGAETYTWRRLDVSGYAKIIANGGEDLPSADANLDENYRPLRSIGAKYGYTTQELRRFAMLKAQGSSIALDQERANAARLFIERKIDKMVALGEPNITNLTGFVNDPNVTLVTPGFGSWLSATAAQMLADLQQLERQVFVQSKETAAADTMLLPIDRYAVVAQTPLGVNNDKTVLQFFLDNALSIKSVEPWYLLATANASSNGPRAVCYKRDPMIAGALVPLRFEAQPPQPKGLAFDIPVEGRCGGSVVRYPLGIAYMDGI